MHRPATAHAATARQGSFADLGTPLSEVTFVVVDLETTGGSAQSDAITEIGAVKVRGGHVLGEFQTLVRPDSPIPAFIQSLTGITDSMVATAPPITSALPAFLEFSDGAVLVAHNAPFDVGFLRAAAARQGLVFAPSGTLDTARVARRVLTRDEAPNCKLATLARLFRSPTTPVHRALADARATVDVLHGLIERVGNDGVDTIEDLVSYTSRVPAEVRAKRRLADGLPTGPGVYLFHDRDDRVLYVGTTQNLRTRVRSYFTAGETRRRIQEMVKIATGVRCIECATTLEARVRELRLIAEYKPPYNRRSKFPERALWLRLTKEAFPRLSVTRKVTAQTAAVGPFGSRRAAEAAAAALSEAVAIRQCTDRLSATTPSKACALADMGRCGAPCDGSQSQDEYEQVTRDCADLLTGRADPVWESGLQRIRRLADEERYEEAAEVRDRAVAFLRAATRAERLRSLIAAEELVAAAPVATGWELILVRRARFAGSALLPRGASVRPYLEALLLSGSAVTEGEDAFGAAAVEEAELLLRHLDQEGVRLVHLTGIWASPKESPARLLAHI
jgi:DNA polymerase-3 subunit epsilon